eukprot:7334712-Pyramimonas_sp.AAC.1
MMQLQLDALKGQISAPKKRRPRQNRSTPASTPAREGNPTAGHGDGPLLAKIRGMLKQADGAKYAPTDAE